MDADKVLYVTAKPVWDIISVSLNVAQITTSRICTVMDGAYCNSTFYPDMTDWAVDRLDNSEPAFEEWFTSDGTTTGSPLTCDPSLLKDDVMSCVNHGDLLLGDSAAGIAIVFFGICSVILGGIRLFMTDLDTHQVEIANYCLTLAEGFAQWGVLNATCSSVLDGASYAFSSLGVIFISVKNAEIFSLVPLIFGFGFWCTNFYVGAVAIFYQQSGMECDQAGIDTKYFSLCGGLLITVNILIGPLVLFFLMGGSSKIFSSG